MVWRNLGCHLLRVKSLGALCTLLAISDNTLLGGRACFWGHGRMVTQMKWYCNCGAEDKCPPVGLFGDHNLSVGGCVGGGERRGAETDQQLAGLSRNDDLHAGSGDDDLLEVSGDDGLQEVSRDDNLHAASHSAGGEGGGAGTEGLPV